MSVSGWIGRTDGWVGVRERVVRMGGCQGERGLFGWMGVRKDSVS